ncbi:MAG: UDP-N-acetylmuramate dehydrogenase [Chlamydiae bacterium]|nr:UDP-N-acetylmuramate dehydrogenase [Chlamydiota bacterium]
MSTPSWIPSIITENQNLKDYTTLKVGGVARYFAEVKSIEELFEVLSFKKKVTLPLFVLGKGSNLILGDGELEAIFIVNRIHFLFFESDSVEVGAGVHVSYLAQKVSKLGFGGLEFFSGIPGTVGGCIVMNAGAAKKETASALKEVTTLDYEGIKRTYGAQELEFGYRKSPFLAKEEIIVSAKFRLDQDRDSEKKRQALLASRLKTQPYSLPTAGCMFKNPVGDSAGRLIDSCGLKGLQIGGVRVSSKHANFFENVSDATAKNILDLVDRVRYEVKIQTGIELELEVLPCFTTCTPIQQHPMGN